MKLLKKIAGLFRKNDTTAITIREIKDGTAVPLKQKNSPKPKKARTKSEKPEKTEKTTKETKKTKSTDKTVPKQKPIKAKQDEKTLATKPAGQPRQARQKPPAVVDDRPFIEEYPADDWDYEAYQSVPVPDKTRFMELGLPVNLLHAVYDIGFSYCTDIQAEILPHSVKGVDVTGKAQTGTGKTAAFLLTILYRLMKNKPARPRKHGAPRALIMAPTRELVMQIEKDAKELAKYCGARMLAVFGGMDYEKQRDALDAYIDIVIATPGRMLDYYKQKVITLKNVEILVLDEADRMLDMGFLPDMRRVINAVPDKESRQTMLFSATLTPEILRLAAMWTNDPIKVEIEPEQVTSANIEQIAYIVTKEDKFKLLFNLLQIENISKGIIFANRKDEVRKLTQKLEACGFSCGMLTGDVSQARRIKTLENLRNGKINFLIATDVAGRGIHVEGVEVVFNYTLPSDPDDYVHRIGRTGRAGSKGQSIAFATEEDAYVLPEIEEHIKEPLRYITPDEELLKDLPEEINAKIRSAKAEKRKSSAQGRKPTGKRPGRPPRRKQA